MLTNDERREVAEIMRDGTRFSVSSCAVVSRLGLECEEFETCAECESMLAKRLADLIEPEPERTVNLLEAVDAICGEMCGDGWDWHNRAEAVVKTVAEMCGAKVVE